jgi:hypothetical protein
MGDAAILKYRARLHKELWVVRQEIQWLTEFSAFGKFLPWHPASPLSKPYATTLTDMRWTMFVLGSLQGLVHCPDRITPLHITAGDHDDVS